MVLESLLQLIWLVQKSPEAREMLVGHYIGLNKAYYRPGEDELLAEYIKFIDLPTINEENKLREIKSQKEKEDELKSIRG